MSMHRNTAGELPSWALGTALLLYEVTARARLQNHALLGADLSKVSEQETLGDFRLIISE